jgi:hypothetical protein
MRAKGRPRWGDMAPGEMVFLYAVRCEQFLKIGISHNIPQRIAGMQADNPFKITLALYRTIRHEAANTIETAVHQALAAFHVRGEWFSCDLSVAKEAIRRAIAEGERRLPRHVLTAEELAEVERRRVARIDEWQRHVDASQARVAAIFHGAPVSDQPKIEENHGP